MEEAIKIFKVSGISIHRWKKKKQEEGHVKNKNRTVWVRKVNQEELRLYVKNNPEKLLSEMGEHFGVSASTIHRNLKKLGIVYKKKSVNMQNVMRS